MASKIIIALCVVLAVAAAVPAPGAWGPPGWGAGAPAVGANTWTPPWLAAAPWFPQWTPCTTVGATCLDCTTKQICTPIGGLQKACTDPTLPYCNAGTCSATPTTECAPVPAVPATTA